MLSRLGVQPREPGRRPTIFVRLPLVLAVLLILVGHLLDLHGRDAGLDRQVQADRRAAARRRVERQVAAEKEKKNKEGNQGKGIKRGEAGWATKSARSSKQRKKQRKKRGERERERENRILSFDKEGEEAVMVVVECG